MKITTSSFEPGAKIPSKYAFAKYNAETHVELTDNVSPQIGWSDLPEGTKSLVLICHDTDVPSKPDDVNQEGKTVPEDLPRVDFYHWVVVDIDPAMGAIKEGTYSSEITPKGKAGSAGPNGTRVGLNNYTQWFEGDAEMQGQYFSYDGPCPPWNDSIIHHYHFSLYAISEARCPIEGKFYGPDVLKAIEGVTLGTASFTATYTINPDAKELG